jgi:RNA polymerase sigma factor (sigma-70 family)
VDPDLVQLQRWRDGDRAAGEVLFERHFESMCRFFATKCAGDADELVQRTFLACVQAKAQFRAESTFRTYLFTVARNELYHYLEKLRREGGRLDVSITSLAELVTTPVTRIARDAERQRMLDAMRTLPIEQQTMLELHYWEELDIGALSEVFETTTGAMRVRLHRARAALREKLEKIL